MSGAAAVAYLEQGLRTAVDCVPRAEGGSLAGTVAAIDGKRAVDVNLSSAIRVHVLEWYRAPKPARQR